MLHNLIRVYSRSRPQYLYSFLLFCVVVGVLISSLPISINYECIIEFHGQTSTSPEPIDMIHGGP